MSHHKNVFIGVGGQGGASLAAIKRAMLYREVEFDALGGSMNCRFLYIDSSANEIEAACKADTRKTNDGAWFVGQEDLRLEVGETLLLDAGQITSAIAMQRPNIAPWLGDGTVFDGDDAVQGRGETLAGAAQRRRYGRVLFACCAGQIDETLSALIKDLDAIPGPDPDPDREGITFHVFATVAGGTGSGSLIDLCTLLRTLHANRVELEKTRANPSIYLYLYVGGTAPQVAQNVAGYFYGNEYATLRDLNGLVSGRYAPFMAAVLPVNRDNHRFQGGSCVKCIFLSSDAATRALSLADQIENMAHTCLDSIALMLSENAGQVRRSIIAEDVKSTFPGEKKIEESGFLLNVPVPQNGRAGRPERSCYFQSAKAVRLRHPALEIQELFKSTYASQVYDRLLNGPLSGRDNRDLTYGTNKKLFPIEPSEDTTYVKLLKKYRKDTLAPYTLEQAKAAWETVDYNEDVLANINENVRQTLQKIKAHVAEVQKAKKDGIRNDYVTAGGIAAGALNTRLVDTVENLRRWTDTGDSQPWGISEIRQFLEDLGTYLAIASCVTTPLDESLGNMPERSQEWQKLGAATIFVGPRSGEMYVKHCQEAYAVLNRALVWHDLQLLRILVMPELRKHVITCIDNIRSFEAKLQKYLDDETDDGEKVSNRLANANPEVFIYLYDRERTQMHNRNIENLSDAEYRRDMSKLENAYFCRLNGNVVPFSDTILNKINEQLNEKGNALSFWGLSRSKHDNIARLIPGEYGRVLFDSVYEASKKEEVDGNCTTMRNQSRLPVILMSGADAPGGVGIEMEDRGVSPLRGIVIGMAPLPRGISAATATELETRKNKWKSSLCDTLRPLVTGRVINDGTDVYSHNDPLEIRVFYTAYWTPARMMTVVNALQSRYERICARTLTGAIDTSTLYFNNIDDGCLSVGNAERPPLVQECLLEAVQQNHETFMAEYEEVQAAVSLI